jgi:ubiquitin-like protein Pup
MPGQVQKRAESTTSKTTETEAPAVTETTHKSSEELKAEMDELLDDIETVLTENATEFVAAFIQKGGE